MGEDLLLRGQDHFRQHGVHRQLCHLPTRLKREKGKVRPVLSQIPPPPPPEESLEPASLRPTSPHRGEFSEVVEGSKRIQLFQSQQQRLIWRRVQEVEVHQVMDPWGGVRNRGCCTGQQCQEPQPRAPAAASPKLFSSSTTLPRLVLWISGTVVSSSSC